MYGFVTYLKSFPILSMQIIHLESVKNAYYLRFSAKLWIIFLHSKSTNTEIMGSLSDFSKIPLLQVFQHMCFLFP